MYFQCSILSLQHLRDCLVNVLVYSVTGILFSSAGEHAFSQCVHHHHSSCSSDPYCSPHYTSNQHAYHTSCHHYSRHKASTLVSTVYQYMLLTYSLQDTSCRAPTLPNCGTSETLATRNAPNLWKVILKKSWSILCFVMLKSSVRPT